LLSLVDKWILVGDDVDRIKRSLLSNSTTASTTTSTTTAATTTPDAAEATTDAAPLTSPLDAPVLAVVAAVTGGGGVGGGVGGPVVSSQTVALDADDAAAVDELLTAYRDSLHVPPAADEAATTAPADCAQLQQVRANQHGRKLCRKLY